MPIQVLINIALNIRYGQEFLDVDWLPVIYTDAAALAVAFQTHWDLA